ncbi:hypothetical protein OTU49_014074 [Cherax quadricarinatus]|uniref:ceramidase n=1 Tax=Cherax quadricarinatus TaxID=27406 RepID=A0AAW0VRY6_CHEQU
MEIPVYIVDLDLPPLQRWAPLMKDKGPLLVDLVDDVKMLITSLVGERVFEIIFNSLSKVATTLPYPFYEELVGISAFSELPLSIVTLYNIFYEALTLCTSIIAQDPNGQLYHGRNLDTGVFLGWDKKNHTWKVAEKLKPLTVELDWKKNGSTLFRSVSFAGYVGVLTAVKQGCIITRDRDNSNILTLGSQKTGSGSWYLVETNYDHWKNPPFFDDRRTPANRCMIESGQKNASLSLIYNVLSTKPVLNKETVYTSVMDVRSGQLQGWIRQCPDPCWPW